MSSSTRTASPLATITTGSNRNDVTQLIPLIEAIPPIRGKRGQPPRRPKHLYADRGYDHETYRDQVRRFEITPHIARRGIEHGSGPGVYRWVVEGARVSIPRLAVLLRGVQAKPGHRPCSVQKRSTSSSSTSASSAVATAAPATHQSAPGSPADR
jgi:hypothetical protein